MALFGLGSAIGNPPFVRGEGVYLRLPEMRDYEIWADLRHRSRAFLTPWEPIWPEDDLTRAAFRRRVRRHVQEMEADDAVAFFIFRDVDDQLVGGLTLGQIRRGVSQAVTLGYWMGEPYAGQRYMSRAVRAAAGFAFVNLRLHRVEAACLLHNTASIRLLKATGFQQEGVARAYLRIAGKWQDHILFALLDGDAAPIDQKRD